MSKSYPNQGGPVNASATSSTAPTAAPQPATPNNSGADASPIDPVMDMLGGGQVVAFRVDLALAVGSTTAGLLLSQFWFWTNSPTTEKRDGWFWMTADEISEQTGLSREEQMTARKRLLKLGVLSEDKRGVPMKLWFHVNKPALIALLREYAKAKSYLWGLPKDEHWGKPKDELLDTPSLGIAQSYLEGKPNDITEISSETSSPISLKNSSGEAEAPPINSPQGEEEPDGLQLSWNAALLHLETIVNTATLNAHLKPMRFISLEGDAAVLQATTAFSRNWIEGRHKAEVEAALGEALGRPVSVTITNGTATNV
ncbi:MAG: DnaA N-terminal domain-containing protein [Armatimonadota bacterium]